MRFLLSIYLLFFLSCQSNIDLSPIKNQIDSVKKNYVKDNRTALFRITATEQDHKILLKGETTFPKAKEELIRSTLGAEVIDSIIVLPSKQLAGKNFGIVNVSVCNIRSTPKHSGELSTQALMGTQLRVLKEENGWYYVQSPDNYLGWLDSGGLVLMDSSIFFNYQKTEKIIVQPAHTYVYREANLNLPIAENMVSDLVAGNILRKTENSTDDTQMQAVLLPDGRKGYIEGRLGASQNEWLTSLTFNPQHIISDAKSFLGVPYLWGGTSSKGFDCSGFTKTVYFLNGIQLERDASLQVHTGIEIETDTASWANLLIGDLLFFGRKATPEKKERISHVAIWMGNGEIIHATEMVKIESLIAGSNNYSANRVKTFIRAKRVLNSIGQNGIIALKDSDWY